MAESVHVWLAAARYSRWTDGSGQAWALAGGPRLPCAICFEDLLAPLKSGSGPGVVVHRSEADDSDASHQLTSMSNVLCSSGEWILLFLHKHIVSKRTDNIRRNRGPRRQSRTFKT